MLLAANTVSKTFHTSDGPLRVLDEVSVSLDAGQSLALTGESGSGKSTLLYLIAGLDAPDSGSIRINGQDLVGMDDASRARLRRGTVGLVFQQFNLIPSLSVAANLSFHARLSGRYDPELIDHLVVRLGLGAVLSRYPEQLSGGQQQRVAIGRALAAQPPLVLADEPTGNLDEATGDAVIALLQDLVAEQNAGLLMVTHSKRLAGQLDREIVLRSGKLT